MTLPPMAPTAPLVLSGMLSKIKGKLSDFRGKRQSFTDTVHPHLNTIILWVIYKIKDKMSCQIYEW